MHSFLKKTLSLSLALSLLAGAASAAQREVRLLAGRGAGEQKQFAALTRHGRKSAVLLHIEAFLGLKAPGREHLGKAHALVLQFLQVALSQDFRFVI